MTSIPGIIIKKRDKQELTKEEIATFVNGVVKGEVQESQIGAMLMASVLNGLSDNETISLTSAMVHSGKLLSWPESWKGKLLDKHSTGGVGDKISLVLAPALAACGYMVPMVSGRGLGHTGGTLDKLESIPGFTVSFSNEDMARIMEKAGCCIVGQTADLVPADKILYSTRDVTGTVQSVGLIASSIISKKAAEQVDVLVLDVKCGDGATTKTMNDSRELAHRMVQIGKGLGIKTLALLTRMDQPIGRMIGNALEVAESLDCLHGRGPSDVMDLVLELGGHLLEKVGCVDTKLEGSKMIENKIKEGEAAKRFCKMAIEQGVERSVAETLCNKDTDVWTILPRAKYVTDVKSETEGFIHDIRSMTCALVSGSLGAGRRTSSDKIQFGVGLELMVSVGDKVNKGDTIVKVHHNCESLSKDATDQLLQAITIQSTCVDNMNKSRVMEVIQ